MTMEQAAISEPLAIGAYAVKLSGMRKGMKVGILGSGPIGMSVLSASLIAGAGAVYVTDKLDERLALAAQSGATWTGNILWQHVVSEILHQEPRHLDMVFECCGQQEALDQAVELLCPGGKLAVVGIPSFDRFSFPVDALRRKEICIQNVRRQNGCAEDALHWIASGMVQVDHWVTHRFPLEAAREAFELVAGYQDGVMKAMIEIG
jgi:L-iditol 2-dehydrogenase